MPKSKSKYYLYKGSMLDDSGVPIAEPLKSYEAKDVLEDYLKEEGWAQISINKGIKVGILEICNLDYKEAQSL